MNIENNLRAKLKKHREYAPNTSNNRWENFFYYVIIVICVVFIFYSGGSVPYALLYISIMAPIVFLIHILVASLQVNYSQKTDKSIIHKGQEVFCTLRVKNRGLLAVPSVEFFWKQEISQERFMLLPFQKREFSKVIAFNYRGIYELGTSRLLLRDYFGLFRLGIKTADNPCVTVLPRLIEIERLSMIRRAESLMAASLAGYDNDEYADIRKYSFGDPLNRIHWNLLAQKNEMYVKVFDSVREWNIACLLDLTPIEHEQVTMAEDFIIECCMAVLNYCAKQNGRLSLIYCVEETIYKVNVRGNISEVYSILASVPFSAGMGLEEHIHRIDSDAAIVIFTAQTITPDLINTSLSGRMADIYHVLTQHRAERSIYDNSGTLRIYDIALEDNIAQALEGAI